MFKDRQTLERLIDATKNMPSGPRDPLAPFKLGVELAELNAALKAANGKLTPEVSGEYADLVYYAVKTGVFYGDDSVIASEAMNIVAKACAKCKVDPDAALKAAVVKYTMRARPGNPKDVEAENRACYQAMTG